MKPKPKQAKQPSERKRDFRNGPVRERETATTTGDSDDGGDSSGLNSRTKKERQVAAAALRQRVDVNGKVGKRGKHSTKQKKRKEEMVARGEAFNDRVSKKATDTATSQRHIKRRNADWEAVNENAFDVLMQADENQQTLAEE